MPHATYSPSAHRALRVDDMVDDSSYTIHLSLPTAHDTDQFGQMLGRSLPAGSVVLLQGDLGTGKTALVKAIGQGLGIPDDIVSPTFVLVNEYHAGRIPLYHFDLYRLEPSQVEALMIEQYWDEAEYEPGIVAIEWAERLGDRPPNALSIHLHIPPFSQEREPSIVNATADEAMNPASEYRTVTVSFESHSSNAMESDLRNLMLGILSNFEQSRRIC